MTATNGKPPSRAKVAAWYAAHPKDRPRGRVRDAAAVLDDVDDVSEELRLITARQLHLYEVRAALYREGQALPERTTQSQLAARAKVTEAAVIAAIKKPPKAPTR